MWIKLLRFYYSDLWNDGMQTFAVEKKYPRLG